MAQKKTSELPAAGAATGAELVPVSQMVLGVLTSVQMTTQDIADLGGGGGSQTLQSVLTTGSILTSDASIVPNADLIGQAVGFGTNVLRFKSLDIWAGTGHLQMTENGLPTDEVFIAHPVQARFLGGQSVLTIGTAGNIFEDSDFNKGLEEAADYSANKTDLSYVTRKMLLDTVAGLKWKNSARVSTTVAGTLATSFENGDTVDGVVLATGNRVLIKDQATQSENGIYTVNASGAPTRSTDADIAAELEGATVTVQEGTSNANTTWTQTTDGITLGSSNIVWAQFGTSVPDASETVKGIIEIATQAEVTTGTDDVRAITPLKYATAVAAKANLASPALTGTPTAPTAAAGTNTTQIATTEFAAGKHPITRTETASTTAALGDDGNFVDMNVAGATTFTLPDNGTVAFVDGSQITVTLTGNGTLSFVAGGSATIETSANNLLHPGKGSPIVARKIGTGTSTWRLYNGTPPLTNGNGTVINGNKIDLGALTSDVNLSGGFKVGVNIAPTAMLTLPAGTTAASSGPVKLTEGVNPTTPEDGLLNYVSNNITFTETSTVYILAKSLQASATLNFGSVASLGNAALTITVTGAADGDVVSIGVPNGSFTAGLIFTGRVSAANTVTIDVYNSTPGAIDPASGTFKVTVEKR